MLNTFVFRSFRGSVISGLALTYSGLLCLGCGGTSAEALEAVEMDGEDAVLDVAQRTSELTTDFFSEVIWQRTTDGRISSWTVDSNGGLVAWGETQFSSNWRILTTGDFNNDGLGDWVIELDGTVSVMLSHYTPGPVTFFAKNRSRPWPSSPGQKVFAGNSADFGLPFMVWAGSIWMQRSTERWYVQPSSLGALPPPHEDLFEGTGAYSLIGTGRFKNPGSRESGWMLRDPSGSIQLRLDPLPGAQVVWHYMPPEWTVATIADFNGDGLDDILWYNTQTNFVAVWGIGSGGQVIANQNVFGPLSDSSWTVQGGGDLDGDGYADIIWRHTGGWVGFWMMGPNFSVRTMGPAMWVGNEWKVVGVAARRR